MSDTAHVIYETDGPVAIIRLNRPEAMNSMNAQTRAEIKAAQEKAEADDNIRIVIMTGSGRAFSSGTDLKEIPADGRLVMDNSVSDYKPLIDNVTNSEKIYIAALNGITGGVALGFALGADLAIMADTATIFSPFANIGLVPDGGASWFFLQHMGKKRAFAAIAECTQIDAATCLDLGMVNKIVPHAELDNAALDWAKSLAERAPLSLRFTKQILNAEVTMTREEAARLESEYQNKCIASEDSKAAIAAFISKTKPVFKGR